MTDPSTIHIKIVRPAIYLTVALSISLAIGCLAKSEDEIVVYAALDREFSEPILKDIGRELNLTIRVKYDQESNKTVGLATELIQSQKKPQADVFWNNEILHTLRLQKLGLLESYQAKNAARFPASFQSAKSQWYGFAGRARVLIVNTELLPEPSQRPDSIRDLADPKWKGKCAIARPVFGTTATHAAVLLASLGAEPGLKLLQQITENAVVQGGNKQVAQKVASGQFAFGVTDTDDAMIEVNRGEPVAVVFPDQGDSEMGTLLIPNTLAIIKNGPNTERAKQLVDRLLEKDIEQRLAAGSSAQRPLANDLRGQWRVEKAWLPSASMVEAGARAKVALEAAEAKPLKLLEADFEAAAQMWDKYKQALQDLR